MVDAEMGSHACVQAMALQNSVVFACLLHVCVQMIAEWLTILILLANNLSYTTVLYFDGLTDCFPPH
eukprot:m.383619 g.383619  ORF g.383619 m.383619 type:complete len:67 (+) comp129051_c0_seq1:67-267(+)